MTTINSADHLFTFKPLPQSPPISFSYPSHPRDPGVKLHLRRHLAPSQALWTSPRSSSSPVRYTRKHILDPYQTKTREPRTSEQRISTKLCPLERMQWWWAPIGVKGGCRWTHKGREVLKEERAHSWQWGDYHLLSLADWCGATELPLIRKNLSIFTLLCSRWCICPSHLSWPSHCFRVKD